MTPKFKVGDRIKLTVGSTVFVAEIVGIEGIFYRFKRLSGFQSSNATNLRDISEVDHRYKLISKLEKSLL